MAIESDILNAVETRLDGISVANGYNTDVQLVATRDEASEPSTLHDQSMLPALLIRYGSGGRIEDQFLDTPRVGRVNEMLAIEVLAVLHDPGTGDEITVRTAKLHEDIKKAIADNLRTDVSTAYRALVRNYRRLDPQWFTPFEAVLFTIEVYHDWEQREPVEPTVSGQVAPYGISSSIAEQVHTLTYTVPATADGVNVYRNDVKVSTLDTTGTYIDTQWQDSIDYQLEAEYSSGSVLKKSEILAFPYYPAETPYVEYHKYNWLIAAHRLNEMVIGLSSPEMLLEAAVRREVEVLRLDDGVLSGLAYTGAGPLTDDEAQNSRLPLCHIHAEGSQTAFTDMESENQRLVVNVDFYCQADRAATDVSDRRYTLNQMAHAFRFMAARNTWRGVASAYDTTILGMQTPQNATRLGNLIVFTANVQIEIRYKWPYR